MTGVVGKSVQPLVQVGTGPSFSSSGPSPPIAMPPSEMLPDAPLALAAVPPLPPTALAPAPGLTPAGKGS